MAQSTSTSSERSIEAVAAGTGRAEVISLAAARIRTADHAGSAIASQLNGPLTALLLYIGEIKQHSDRIAETLDERAYLQTVVENALRQTEQVCALVKLISDNCLQDVAEPANSAAQGGEGGTQDAQLRKPLTPREREALRFISEGLSNKEGALRMKISPRTFESHRAEIMRKLGARNTAELVRAALLDQFG